MTETGEDAYSGVFGAFPYALRSSDSRLFRSYVLVGGLLALLLALGFGLALVVQVANTTGGTGGTFTFSRAFFIFVGLFVVAPLLAPVLFVARRHRRDGSHPTYDRAMAVMGFLFVLSLYLGLVASIPPTFVLDGETVTRDDPGGVTGPVVAVLYALPEWASPLVPALVGVAMYVVHRRLS